MTTDFEIGNIVAVIMSFDLLDHVTMKDIRLEKDTQILIVNKTNLYFKSTKTFKPHFICLILSKSKVIVINEVWLRKYHFTKIE